MGFDLAISTLHGDLSVDGGALVRASRSDEVAQRVRTRIIRNVGDWFLDLTAGLPWYGDDGLLGRRGVMREVEALVSAEAADTDGVVSVSGVSARYDSATKEVSISGTVYTVYGEAAFEAAIGG